MTCPDQTSWKSVPIWIRDAPYESRSRGETPNPKLETIDHARLHRAQ